MPKITFNTALRRAIEPALNDRESLLECYSSDSPESREIEREIEMIKSMRGRKFKDTIKGDDVKAAFLTLLYGEQYERGFAESNPGKEYEKKAIKNADLFREFRLSVFGKSVFEKKLEDSENKLVEAFDYIGKKSDFPSM